MTVTLTAHDVEQDSEGPSTPGWSSHFTPWGGDCAVAGTSPTCTIQIGKQQPSNPHSDFRVEAYFQVDSSSFVG